MLLLVLGSYVSKRWHVQLADIYTAFTSGKIDGELYVEWNTITYKLPKSLYGSKQSPRLWYESLIGSLKQFGFIQLESCEIFPKVTKDRFEVIVMVHVYDIIILSDALNETNWAKVKLKSFFEPTYLRPLQYYLNAFSIVWEPLCYCLGEDTFRIF